MNAKRAVAAIYDEDGRAVRRDVGEDGFAACRARATMARDLVSIARRVLFPEAVV